MSKFRSRKPGKVTTYHTDPEGCPMIDPEGCPMIDPETAKEISERYIEYHEMTECCFCTGEMTPANKGQSQ